MLYTVTLRSRYLFTLQPSSESLKLVLKKLLSRRAEEVRLGQISILSPSIKSLTYGNWPQKLPESQTLLIALDGGESIVAFLVYAFAQAWWPLLFSEGKPSLGNQEIVKALFFFFFFKKKRD